MGINGVGPGTASAIAATANDAAGMIVLRKAMDAGASVAVQLLGTLPRLEPHLGGLLDVRL
ncbi:MAG TPA: YjfB family protein [Acidimicrobiales bacterium]|nr:YjfB family protein [Acidimicrobiales bacterium]